MKNDYFDNNNADINRKKRKSKTKRKNRVKGFLIFLSVLTIALAAFVITIKILAPDYDFSSLVPKRAVSFVNEDILGKTTTEETTETLTHTTTTRKTLDYLEFSEFSFDTKKQGNYIGNLLNGGKVGTDFTYIYHIADGKGIYRFIPSSENYSLVFKTSDTLSSLNLRGDYFYYVNDTDKKLYKLQKGSNKPRAIAEDVRFVYVYDSLVYFITNTNKLCVMDVKELIPVTVYYSADDELNFIGISKERVFFSVTDYSGNTEFLTIDNFAKSPACKFRDSEMQKEAVNFVMENGYLYYIKRDTESGEGHFVCRQKFGSRNEIELCRTNTNFCYPITDGNRLYYADWKDNKLIMKEFNMNSKSKKTLLSVKDVGEDDEPKIQHGGEYDFIIGSGYYSGSCIYTSSTNIMKFKNSKWSY